LDVYEQKIVMDPQDTLRFYRGRHIAIENLVYKITVRVDVKKDIDWAWNLQYLLALKRAEYIRIEILGLGALDRHQLPNCAYLSKRTSIHHTRVTRNLLQPSQGKTFPNNVCYCPNCPFHALVTPKTTKTLTLPNRVTVWCPM
jgi:hypothetical protein